MLRIIEKLRPACFFEYFDGFYIPLIVNDLSLCQNFRLFVLGKKTLEVLNFYFGRKYHFDILKVVLSGGKMYPKVGHKTFGYTSLRYRTLTS